MGWRDRLKRLLGRAPGASHVPSAAAAGLGDGVWPGGRPAPYTRTFIRVPLDAPCSLRPQVSGRPSRISARTVDVSAGGARVFAMWGLAAGDRLRHLLSFPGEPEAVPIEARVVWSVSKGEGVEMGIAYGDLPGVVRERIDALVERRFRDVHVLTQLLASGPVGDRRRGEFTELLRRLGLPEDASEEELRSWGHNLKTLFAQGRARLLRGPGGDPQA